MMRLPIHALPLLLAAISPAMAANQSIAEIKKSVASALDGVSGSQETATLGIQLLGADSAGVKVGSKVSLAFESNRNCFVTLFWLESGGNINLIKAWRHEVALTPNTAFRVFPDPSLEKLKITPPLGKDVVYAFCTAQRPIFSGVSFTDGFADISVEDAATQIPQLIQELSNNGEILATSKLPINIVGRDKSVFSEKDVVDIFRGPLRSTVTRTVLTAPVQFDTGSDRISDSAMEMLNNIGSAFTSSELNQMRFRINGHTDATGSDAYNNDLSKKRALSVKSYLVTRFNIEPSRLETVGWGENMAKSDNSTHQGRAENRRVEFELLE